MFFLCSFHNFLLVSPTSKQVEALWCPDFHEHFQPPENLAVSRRVAPSVLPWCHSPKEPGRWFRAFSRFCFMGFLWEKLKKKKKGISSLTSFSEHWLFRGAHEISKDAHVSCQTCNSKTSYSSCSLRKVVERINYPHFPSTFLVSALPGYWKYVRSWRSPHNMVVLVFEHNQTWRGWRHRHSLAGETASESVEFCEVLCCKKSIEGNCRYKMCWNWVGTK